LFYRPGHGAASLIKWHDNANFQTIFDHPDAEKRNVGVGPFDLQNRNDRVIAADVDGDGREELLFYRPGHGAASLIKWHDNANFQTIFDHPDAPPANVGVGPFDLMA